MLEVRGCLQAVQSAAELKRLLRQKSCQWCDEKEEENFPKRLTSVLSEYPESDHTG